MSRLIQATRRHPWIAFAGVLFAAWVIVWLPYDYLSEHQSEGRYRAAVEAANRLDPGWREYIRATPVSAIAGGDNSATLVDRSFDELPRDWSPLGGQWPPLNLDPAQPIGPDVLVEIRVRRDEAAAGLAAAHRLAGTSRGRFAEWTSEFPHGVPLCREKVETVAGLLYLDAMIRIDEHDLTGAVTDVRAMINAGRSLAEDPSLAVQAGRGNVVIVAVATLERILAQGQLAGPVLADLQMLMEDEARHPLALVSIRGDRAAQGCALGRSAPGASALRPSLSQAKVLRRFCTAGNLRDNQSRLLEENNRLAELAALPADQQGPILSDLERHYYQRWNQTGLLTRIYTFPFHSLFPATLRAGSWQARHHAFLHIAIVALASERFRLDHGAGRSRLANWFLRISPKFLTILTAMAP